MAKRSSKNNSLQRMLSLEKKIQSDRVPTSTMSLAPNTASYISSNPPSSPRWSMARGRSRPRLSINSSPVTSTNEILTKPTSTPRGHNKHSAEKSEDNSDASSICQSPSWDEYRGKKNKGRGGKERQGAEQGTTTEGNQRSDQRSRNRLSKAPPTNKIFDKMTSLRTRTPSEVSEVRVSDRATPTRSRRGSLDMGLKSLINVTQSLSMPWRSSQKTPAQDSPSSASSGFIGGLKLKLAEVQDEGREGHPSNIEPLTDTLITSQSTIKVDDGRFESTGMTRKAKRTSTIRQVTGRQAERSPKSELRTSPQSRSHRSSRYDEHQERNPSTNSGVFLQEPTLGHLSDPSSSFLSDATIAGKYSLGPTSSSNSIADSQLFSIRKSNSHEPDTMVLSRPKQDMNPQVPSSSSITDSSGYSTLDEITNFTTPMGSRPGSQMDHTAISKDAITNPLSTALLDDYESSASSLQAEIAALVRSGAVTYGDTTPQNSSNIFTALERDREETQSKTLITENHPVPNYSIPRRRGLSPGPGIVSSEGRSSTPGLDNRPGPLNIKPLGFVPTFKNTSLPASPKGDGAGRDGMSEKAKQVKPGTNRHQKSRSEFQTPSSQSRPLSPMNPVSGAQYLREARLHAPQTIVDPRTQRRPQLTDVIPSVPGNPPLPDVAKFFVVCCSCGYYHDMPSKIYECMARPDNVVTDKDLGVSGLITTAVKCCWCAHGMSTSCCAGYMAILQHRERLH